MHPPQPGCLELCHPPPGTTPATCWHPHPQTNTLCSRSIPTCCCGVYHHTSTAGIFQSHRQGRSMSLTLTLEPRASQEHKQRPRQGFSLTSRSERKNQGCFCPHATASPACQAGAEGTRQPEAWIVPCCPLSSPLQAAPWLPGHGGSGCKPPVFQALLSCARAPGTWLSPPSISHGSLGAELGTCTAIHLPVSKELRCANRLPGRTVPPHHRSSAQELWESLGGTEERGWVHTCWRWMLIFFCHPFLTK